jgi:hypothetical protein
MENSNGVQSTKLFEIITLLSYDFKGRLLVQSKNSLTTPLQSASPVIKDMSFIIMLSTGYSVRTKRSSQVNLATYQLEQPLMLALHILQNLTSTYAAIKVFRYVMTTEYDLTLTYLRQFIGGIDKIDKIHSFSMLAESNPYR